MRKIILAALTILTILTSCQKEDDLQPLIPPTNTNSIDSITNNIDSVTITMDTTLPTNNFIGEGKKYKVLVSEFEMNCSELTNYSVDTSYSYYDENIGEAEFLNGIGELSSTVYPLYSNTSPAHAMNFTNNILDLTIKNYTYNEGILSINFLWVSTCVGMDDIEWNIDMVVTEYSDNMFSLSLDQQGSYMGISWNSRLNILLEEDI